MEDIGVHHITRSPCYHQSNGLAEIFVQLMKSLLSTVKEPGKNPHFALMIHRNTQHGNGLQSQMELLCTRQTRCYLPMSYAARMQVGKLLSNHMLIDLNLM